MEKSESKGGAALLRPPRGGNGIGDYSLRDFAARWMMQQADLAETDYYRDANMSVLGLADENQPPIVLIGDSITEFWVDLDKVSIGAGQLINRGIAGQNTSQMLLRFETDVVALKPASVIILGGTNDLRCYVGDPSTIEASALRRISDNLTAMADIAFGRHIRFAFCTLPPVGGDPEIVARDPAAILLVNRFIKKLSRERGSPVIDYHAALADGSGALKLQLSDDGVHPNPAGYAAMMPVLERGLSQLAALP